MSGSQALTTSEATAHANSARSSGGGPADISRPADDPEDSRLREIARRLTAVYRDPRHYNKREPVAELVFILLSAATPEHLYRRTYNALRAAFPRWADVARAPAEAVAAAIAPGGLARKKAGQLQAALERIAADRGRVSLAFLRRLEDAEAEAYLRSLPGVGAKTARCVLMYALGRAVLPVDTHVWRVSGRLGLIGGDPLAQPTPNEQNRLQSRVPPPLRYGIHVNMVAHGRAVCRAPRPGALRPRCPACVLRDLCPGARAYYGDVSTGDRSTAPASSVGRTSMPA